MAGLDMPVDHRLARVYRYGGGLMGLVLITFGVLGFTNNVGFFSTSGREVAGMSTNGALSVISVVVGAILLIGAFIGGNVASTVNIVVGALFVISGFVNLGLIGTPSINYLSFKMPNVIFSFVVGLLVMTFGLYGRVSGHLPHDNPYWRSRHPDDAAREDAYRSRSKLLGRDGASPVTSGGSRRRIAGSH
ncbi:DUF4383 domain-containing protein [Streptomyces sp. SID3343]|uniref:DUF4383 domain-containing protein n=1 Tax=Streptomyces sp. SID3343 TaxID=2690260 RepID=UPI001370AC88|nr:DUF4383 domain-containing protein [Streptomyces sp. SID3343]MYW00341.1 DUF4383 domain-containing protein [Streptomyces sp. SID3343]